VRIEGDGAKYGSTESKETSSQTNLKKPQRRNAMKTIYSTLITLLTLLVFALSAGAKPPSWDTKINGAGRFKVLAQFNGEAVLDKETGLVWEQSPSTTTFSWLNAQIHCNQLNVGGRLGWRVPTIQELATLVDPNNSGGNPDLPPGHPFTNVQSSEYWSATTRATSTGVAWVVLFGSGSVGVGGMVSTHFVWCVRGGQGVDPQ